LPLPSLSKALRYNAGTKKSWNEENSAKSTVSTVISRQNGKSGGLCDRGASDEAHRLVTLVDQFIATRKITHYQYRVLTEMVLADGNIDETERQQINRLFDAIQTGRVKVLD
jgi:hypothetical protein